ncbi:NAD(P)H-dependent oxidoreductase [Thalassococcus sp. S3]|uniref:NAD(P)H-dependent oxidoreductase n=1 Tax=Thalassococcus sp. S3 TaxID=2017482 RepID=UPI001024494A|nr:NAD(P)H-dependent oxidoreductase [Thalassococcus sp. S3]QBF30707.1 oxidoreductase [Thalassococcus sp. S3]
MTRKILILDGHPNGAAFCGALAREAEEGARAKDAETRIFRLSEMRFDPDLTGAYKVDQPLEPDLEAFWNALLWCDHFILVHPLWWGSAPAKLKGLFDRIFKPGIAFRYVEGKALPDGLLAGRNADVLITSDTPTWYFRLVYRLAWPRILRKQILGFCGLNVRHIRNLATIRNASPRQREGFLAAARSLGALSAG